MPVMRAAQADAESAKFAAQLAQAEAELTRLRGGEAPAWAKAAELWEAIPQPYEAAHCRFRQGEALLASGDKSGG